MAFNARKMSVILACAAAAAGVLAAAPAARAASTTRSYSGGTSDGGTWVADVPSSWNGTVLLYSHGFGTLAPSDAPDPTTQAELLRLGYALVGSSEAPANGNDWTLGSALSEQFQALSAIKKDLPRKPAHVIAVGTSMGGLVSALEDQDANGRIDGALTTCGLVDGGGTIEEYQLEGEYAISRLLDSSASLSLVNFPGDATGQGPGQGVALALQLTAVAQAAQQTAAGKARLALAMAFLNVADWASGDTPPARGDFSGQEAQQYQVEFGGPGLNALGFVEYARGWMEEAAGGNPSWTRGVNFAAELARSPYYAEVAALYRKAGLSLKGDLGSLAAGATITADPAAVRWFDETSQPSGRLQVPELDLHTISDQLIPVGAENLYASNVTAAGSSARLRQAYVRAIGHCNFTPSELTAGVLAVQHRVSTGHWGNISPAGLNASANSLGLGAGAAFIPYRPAPLTGDVGQPRRGTGRW